MKSKMTINELLKMCEIEVRHGNGDRTIYISSDDEWNDFHELFYGFTPNEDAIANCLDSGTIESIKERYELKDIILLG